MDQQQLQQRLLQEDEQFNLKKELFKYLRFWPWFIVGVIIAVSLAFIYLKRTPYIYSSVTKVKVLDEKDGLEVPTEAFIFKRSQINLENESEIMKSYQILEQVVRDLNLTTSFYNTSGFRDNLLTELPFGFKQRLPIDSITVSRVYDFEFNTSGLSIIETINELERSYNLSYEALNADKNLPFELIITNEQLSELKGQLFTVVFNPIKPVIIGLKGQLNVSPVGKDSDLLQLSTTGSNKLLNERIINKVIEAFNNDGVHDRQLVYQRTLDFIDERFYLLANELDSIEGDKRTFKQQNNLAFIESNSQIDLQIRSESELRLFEAQNQLLLANMLSESIAEESGQLLPANIGVDSPAINNQVNVYNETVLERDKLQAISGANNPSVRLLSAKLVDLEANVKRSLNSYVKQLQVQVNELQKRNQKYQSNVAALPQKEKLLRSIERQQQIKETLYLFLLQKREEASINLAVTEPTVKIVEYALTGSLPIAPKTKIIYLGALVLGLLVPFGVVYLNYLLDTKVHTKEDLQKFNPEIPILAEIPKIFGDDKTKLFSDPTDRSPLAESFRILASNVNFSVPKQQKGTGNIIYCTSTVKGEGKTFVSTNLSLALASLGKKVLLIGCDLRNPQIHNYLNVDKKLKGLSNYLHDDTVNWKELILNKFEKLPTHDIMISGNMPPNPVLLLNNGRFETLLEEVRTQYDYIVVDTAPTLLVTDTLQIAKYADLTVYVTRDGVTEKEVLQWSKELNKEGKLNNINYVLNGLGNEHSHGYSYKYNYRYSYNYGYGYGYGEDTGNKKRSFFSRFKS